MPDRWVKDLRDEAEAQGFRVIEMKKGWMFYPPDPDASLVMVHLTNSDKRSQANAISQLVRSGFIKRRK